MHKIGFKIQFFPVANQETSGWVKNTTSFSINSSVSQLWESNTATEQPPFTMVISMEFPMHTPIFQIIFQGFPIAMFEKTGGEHHEHPFFGMINMDKQR